MNANEIATKIFTNLRLSEQAQVDAQNGQPQNGHWGVMDSIIPEVWECGNKELQIMAEHRDTTRPAISAFQSVADNFSNNMRNLARGSIGNEQVENAKVARNTAIAAYNTFKNNNGLVRDASGDDRMAQILWALVIMMVEGFLNHRFFAPAFDGLIEAFTAAFFVSVINVGFAFIGGALGLRYLVNHCNVEKRLGGLICFLICLFICILTVLLSAWFRGNVDILRQENIGLAEISTQAWTKSLQDLQSINLWGIISSLNSFLLVFVGLFCTFLGLWKGYEYDDPYPGFGDMYRTKENASEKLQEEEEKYQQQEDKLQDKKNELLTKLDSTYNTMKTEFDGFNLVVNKNINMQNNLKMIARNVLRQYYQANCQARATPAPLFPDHFPDDQTFNDLEARRLDIANSFETIRERFNIQNNRFDELKD